MPPQGLEGGIKMASQKKSGKQTFYKQKLEAIREVQEKKRHKQEVAEKDGEILGYINGPIIHQPYITGDLFETIEANPKTGGYQSILGVAVSKKTRKQGIARILIEKMEELAAENNREGIPLTCKEELISFYEKLDYVNHGLSESKHGGVSWYNLVKLTEEAK